MEFIPPKDEHAFLFNFPKSKTFDKLKKKIQNGVDFGQSHLN